MLFETAFTAGASFNTSAAPYIEIRPRVFILNLIIISLVIVTTYSNNDNMIKVWQLQKGP
jgi:hypothetical protein